MSNDINVMVLLILSTSTILITIALAHKEQLNVKLVIYAASLTTFIYSGFGVSYIDVNWRYGIKYVVFLLCLLITLKFAIHITLKGTTIKYTRAIEINEIHMYNNARIYHILSIFFIGSLLIYLLYPSFRISDFFHPIAPSSRLVYFKRAQINSNSILSLANTINILTLPFFCLTLRDYALKSKKGVAVILILLWAYLDYLKYFYLSRYEMMIYLLFTFCVLFFLNREGVATVKRKYIVLLLCVLITVVPFLNAYVSIRNGAAYTQTSLGKAIVELIHSETYYPQRYNVCENITDKGGPVTFIMWIICLPIPSAIFPSKPKITTAYTFTEAVSGLVYGAQDYYTSSLPSVMGEGLIIWGGYLYWMHAVIIGFVVGLVFGYLIRRKELTILYYYMLLMLLTLGRGGASSYMSTIINGLERH